MPKDKLVIIFKFIGLYAGLVVASFLVYKGIDIANTIFLLVGFMVRDLYRSGTTKGGDNDKGTVHKPSS